LKKKQKKRKKVNFAVDILKECGYKYFPTDMAKHNEKPDVEEMYNIVNITTTVI
jgi:hypothetical protein